MLKIVLDANIFVSAVLKPHSDLAKIFGLIREDKIKLILSEDILSEIRAVLLYPKIKKRRRRAQKEIEEFLNKASQASILAQGRIEPDEIGRIPRTINTFQLR
jgi:putative PIN family toxin of toxin-antitoxin system